jgi:hypothetical protein
MAINANLAAIKDFIKNGQEENLVGDLGKIEVQAHKRFQSCLIWSLSLQKGLEEDLSVIAREAVADLSTSYLLLYRNLYKASLLCLRSSIENTVRLVCLSSGIDPNDISTVSNLFSEARGLNRYSGLSTSIFNRLYSLYAELCNFVHSSSPDYMALRIPFSEMSAPDQERAEVALKYIDAVLSDISQLLYLFFSESLKNVEHKLSDQLLDTLPKSIKKQVHS